MRRKRGRWRFKEISDKNEMRKVKGSSWIAAVH